MHTDGAISKILIATDFSTGSLKAWKTAQNVAGTLSAELTLLHVLPATPVDVDARVQAEERQAALRALQAEHQLGVPRAYEDEAEPAMPQVFEGPLVGDAVNGFSQAGREWAAQLEEWAAYGRLHGAKVRTVLRVGAAYREIVAEAKEHGVDLVLVGTHGRGEIHRLLVGSTADRVIRLAPCPVMTVKDN
jgi:nucleotide-binding universal stress UspA family protein